MLALGWMQCWWYLPCMLPGCCGCCWEMEPSAFSSCLLLLLLCGNHMSSGAGFQMAFSNWGSLSHPSVMCCCGAIKGSSGKHHLRADSMDHMQSLPWVCNAFPLYLPDVSCREVCCFSFISRSPPLVWSCPVEHQSFSHPFIWGSTHQVGAPSISALLHTLPVSITAG